MNITLIILAVLAVIVFGMYNALVGKKNAVENAFSSMDVILKKRYDLIPNLVNTVKQYMKHEAGLLTQVTELRAKATTGNLNSDDRVAIDNQISKAVGGIMVAVENYPDLKASTNFLDLQKSLNEVEEQISAARRSFNATVLDFNNAVEMFPTNLMAGVMGYSRKQMFEIPDAERQNVNVKDMFSE